MICVSSITINPSTVTLNVGCSYNLSKTVCPANATYTCVTWSSSNTSVATVDSNGKVFAQSAGTATIKAMATDGSCCYGTCSITAAVPVTAVTVSSSSLQLHTSDSLMLTATVCPTNASNKCITWSSSNANVATVNPSSGLVTSQSVGTATIKAAAADGSCCYGTCCVTVSSTLPVTSITLCPSVQTVNVNSSFTLTPTVCPANASNKNITWTSSNTSVATVNTSGKVCGISAGTATITATAQDGSGKSVSCNVTVANTSTILTTSVTVCPADIQLNPGDASALVATVSPTNASNKNVKWSSSNPSIATVNASSGLVTALISGTVMITATPNDGSGKIGTCVVSVIAKPVLNTIGSYKETFTDMSISAPGFSIDISRTYDSMKCSAGPFGYGWTLNSWGSCLTTGYNQQTVTLPDESIGNFSIDGSVYTGIDTRDKLVRNADGTFQLTRQNSDIYNFSCYGYLTGMIDANGNTFSIILNALHYPARITDSVGRIYKFCYNPCNLITSISIHDKDENFISSISYQYTNNLLTKLCDAYGNAVSSYTYDCNSLLSCIRDAYNNIVATITYTGCGVLSKFTDLSNLSTSYRAVLNGSNQTITVNDSNNYNTTYAYDSINRHVSTTSNHGVESKAYANCYSDICSTTDIYGKKTTYTYDANGNVTSITYPDGTSICSTYDSRNNLLSSRDVNGNSVYYNYDASNNVTLIAKPKNGTDVYNPNGDQTKFYITKYTYGYKGQLIEQTNPDGSTVTNVYDDYGRIAKSTLSSGNVAYVTRSIYDVLGRILQKIGPSQYDASKDGLPFANTYADNSVGDRYTYDLNGNVLTYTDPAGNTTTNQYNAQGNLVKTDYCDVLTQTHLITRTVYDSTGRVKQQIAPWQYKNTFDCWPASNAYNDQTVGDRYTYDCNGNILTHTDPQCNSTTNIYDCSNNLLRSVYTDAVTGGHVYTRYLYDSNNRLVQKIDNSQYDLSKDSLPSVNAYSDCCVGDRYSYDQHDNIIQHIDPQGNITVNMYDCSTNGQLIRSTYTDVVTSGQLVTRYLYDINGRVTQQIGPTQYDARYDGLPCSNTYSDCCVGDRFTYDRNGNVLTHTDPQGNITTNIYDGDDTVIKSTYWDVITGSNLVTRYLYDSNKRIVQQIGHSQYDSAKDGLPANNTYSDSTAGDRYTYDVYGHVLTHTDPQGNITTNTYDLNNNIVKSVLTDVTTGRTLVTRNLYDVDNRLIQKIGPSKYIAANDGLPVSNTYSDPNVGDRYVYDYNGNVTLHTDPQGNTTTNIYDSRSNLLRSTYVDAATGTNLVTRNLYDINKRITQKISPNKYVAANDGLPAANTYSDATAGDRYIYDVNSNVVTHYDPSGNRTDSTFDKNNRLIKSVCGGNVTRHLYDVNGKLLQTIYPSQYDSSKDGLTKTPSVNTYQNSDGSQVSAGDRYTYDINGKVLTHADSCGKLVINSYNRYSNIIKSYFYDAVAGVNKVTRYLYDVKNRLIQQVNPEEYVSTDDNYPTGYNNANVGDRYTYNPNDSVHTHTDPAGNVTSYTYDASDHVKTMTEPTGAVISYDSAKQQWYTEQYPNGNINTVVYDDDELPITVTGSNGVVTAYSYNGHKQVAGYTLTVGSLVKDYTYGFDLMGNISYIKLGGSLQETYTYDEQGQLTRHDSATQNGSFVYAYDANGNILSKTTYPYTTGTLGTPTSTISYTYTAPNRLTAYNGGTITYTAGGEMQTYNGNTYAWGNGRLTGITGSIGTVSYSYNADGMRLSKTVGGVTTNFIRNGSQLVSQSDSTNTISFTYDSEGKPATVTVNGTVYTYELSAKGDVIGLLDGSNNEVVSYAYDVWGKLLSTTGSLASTIGSKNPLRYRGYYYDNETGLYYLQYRYYNPDFGRFVSQDDPYFIAGIVPLDVNLYAYCGNNPVMFDDPSGHDIINCNAHVENIGSDYLNVYSGSDGKSIIGSIWMPENLKAGEVRGNYVYVTYHISKSPGYKSGWVHKENTKNHKQYIVWDKKTPTPAKSTSAKTASTSKPGQSAVNWFLSLFDDYSNIGKNIPAPAATSPAKSTAASSKSSATASSSSKQTTSPTQTNTSSQTNHQQCENILASRIKSVYYGKRFTGAGQCFGFASMVFKDIFNIKMSSTSWPRYLLQSTAGVKEVGHIYPLGGTATGEQVKNLFSNSRIGDWVQMVWHTGSITHSAILAGVDSTGFSLYQANYDGNNSIGNFYYTWSGYAAAISGSNHNSGDEKGVMRNNGVTIYTTSAY